ncbi:MAG TPA: protein adenylyltransferase SelO family protein, partial [Hyphomicrobiaceae bacterium]|nr:protein adenylyltransferase SelO family protein [Hyphomicrobiaceae bacterium]
RMSVAAVAEMGAEWFQAGFVHGVLNTDNTVITGESFDYGPWRFLPTLDPAFTAAYFDETGLYAYGRQAGALFWNLQRLAECLLPLSSEAALVAALETFGSAYQTAVARFTLARLGLADQDGRGLDEIVRPFYAALAAANIPFERAFFDLVGGARKDRIAASPYHIVYDAEPFASLTALMRDWPKAAGLEAALAHSYFADQAPRTMLIDEVEAIWAPIAERDDWQHLHKAIAAIRQMGAAHAPLIPSRASQPAHRRFVVAAQP